ncbi:hypothetical protein HYT56_02200 [Candidatus Woesearchaeota archaeon]|nr:hypothetical protein [Candidatus Woesearchaeota archaeon]
MREYYTAERLALFKNQLSDLYATLTLGEPELLDDKLIRDIINENINLRSLKSRDYVRK